MEEKAKKKLTVKGLLKALLVVLLILVFRSAQIRAAAWIRAMSF